MADMRRCIGSTKFGIEAHEAPVTDFPVQPSQKDGLGRMCKPHWNEYTSALRKAALARKAAEGEATATSQVPAGSRKGRAAKPTRAPKPEQIRTKGPRRERVQTPVGGSQIDAG